MITLLYLTALLCHAHQFDPNSFDNRVSLDSSVDLYWSVKPTFLRLGFVANASGWFGFGFSPNGGMPGADIMLARAFPAKVEITDHFVREKGVPEEDIKSYVDWEVVFAMFMHNTFSVEVWRTYDTKDPDDVPIVPGAMRVIWATNSVNELIHHDKRGSASVTFIPDNRTSMLPTTANYSLFNAQLSLSPISANATSVACANFALPSDTSYHAVLFQPIVNSSFVSSILAYGCPSFPSMSTCEMSSMLGCDTLVYAWSAGGDRLVLPEEAGILIGEGGVKYIALQVRYARSSSDPAVDSSGFQFVYTPDLRPNDAGYIKLGSPDSQLIIPENKKSYSIMNDCTISAQQQPLNVVASAFHMHAFGKQAWSALYREGRYLSTIGKNLYWDVLLEEYRSFVPEAFLLPSDRILTTCVYSTSGYPSVVHGGYKNDEETCLNFLLVYPKPSFSDCMNANFSLRRDFDGVHPWEPQLTQAPGARPYDRFRMNVVILDQVMSCFSLIAATFMILCWCLFRDLRTFAFHLILMMAIADFFNCLGAIFGLPDPGPFCEFQSWLVSYFSLASILWTSAIAFTLHMAFLKQREGFSPGNIESKKKPFHLFCWGVPLVLSILPALTHSYGQDYAFCWILDEGSPHVMWRFVQFYLPLWLAFAYNAFVYVQVFRKLRQQDSPPALLLRLTMYPLILVICWFPDTIDNVAELFSFERPWFNAFAVFFSASNGLLNALVYGLTEDIRTRLCYRRAQRTSVAQEPSVVREDI